MREKKTFTIIFVLLAVLLAVLPLLVTFNEVLTKTVEHFGLYMWVQDRIVPMEIRMVSVLLSPLPINFAAYQEGFIVNGTFLRMTWNCIGWQSLLLLTITVVVGLRSGSYTLLSKAEMVLIGLLGTFIINLIRLTFIVALFAISRPLYAVVYHDYLAAIVTIIWLFFFWWFAYSFVLKEKSAD